jgi:hypothetical protein
MIAHKCIIILNYRLCLVVFLLLVLVSPSMIVRRRLVYLVARIAVVSKAQRWTWQQVCVIVVGFPCSVFSRFYAETAPTTPRPMCRSEARSRESAIDWQSAAGSQDTHSSSNTSDTDELDILRDWSDSPRRDGRPRRSRNLTLKGKQCGLFEV